MKLPRPRFRTASGWCSAQTKRSRTDAGSRGSRVPGAAQHEVVRCRPGTVPVRGGPGSAVHRSALLRAAPHPGHTMASDCSHALAGPIPVFSCFSADSDLPSRVLRSQTTRTPSFPRRILRPGFASLLHSPRIEGWAERRETFGCSGTRAARHNAACQAPSEAPCVP